MPNDAPETVIDIKVATPLPSNVVLTLGALIDAAWPGSELAVNEDRFTHQVIFRIDNAARRPLDDADAAALHVDPVGIEVSSLGPEGAAVITPVEIAANLLPTIQAAFEKFPDAENYLEMPVHDRSDGHRYLLTFARSKDQTPHELRVRAERELADARGRIHRQYAAALWRLRIQPRPDEVEDSYAAGVQAALDTVRARGFPYTGPGAADGENMSADG
jgi:hypothetical protein